MSEANPELDPDAARAVKAIFEAVDDEVAIEEAPERLLALLDGDVDEDFEQTIEYTLDALNRVLSRREAEVFGGGPLLTAEDWADLTLGERARFLSKRIIAWCDAIAERPPEADVNSAGNARGNGHGSFRSRRGANPVNWLGPDRDGGGR